MKSLAPAVKNGLLLLLLVAWVTACAPRPKKLKTGTWRGVLQIANQQVPFLMEVATSPSGQPLAYLINGR